MPKTGGLTLRHFLLRRYGTRAFDHHDDRLIPPEILGSMFAPDLGENDRFLRSFASLPTEWQAAVMVFTGHFTYGIHDRLPGPNTYVTLVRDPIDRTLSQFAMRRRNRAPDLTLREFLTHRHTVGDQQTRRLAGGEWARGGADTTGMLEAAKQHLVDDFAVVGLKERWDETMLVLADTFGWERPYYHRYNERPDGRSQLDVPADLVDRLREMHQNDEELYRFAKARFEERLARDHPDVERRVRRLRRGNDLWQRADPHVQRARHMRYRLRSGAARTYHRLIGR